MSAMLDLRVIAVIIDTIGKLLVSFTAIMVHHRVLAEHRIDKKVFHEMRIEQRVGILGVLLIVVGSGMEILIGMGVFTL